ncbi:MAG: amidohydrolase family protein [Gammaproteobacteria bacterium]|nr:amidohydrolase family protein [Gammaproteobacteria bacterium]
MHRMTVIRVVNLALILTGLPAFADGAPADGPAALILTGGRVHSAGGVVEALAVDGRGVIVTVGNAAEVAKLRGLNTRVIELAGRSVLPGFHDMHVHPLFAGLRRQECVIPQGSDERSLKKGVTDCVARVPRPQWITGGQWDASAIGRIPDRKMLDKVAPDQPVLLSDTSGHSALVNSKALEVAGITRATADPEGGIIERDSAGEPTGVLRESAIELVRSLVPLPTDEQVRTALQWAVQDMLANGITSFTEASMGFAAGPMKELEAYVALADAGLLRQSVRLCLNWMPGSKEAEDVIASRNFYARDRVSPDCIKIFLDGVPTDSHTAAMLEPYADTMEGRDDRASRYGMLLVEQPVLDQAVTRFDRMGLAVKFHAAGDAAVRAGLHAVAAARKANGFSGVLHDVGHCTFVAQEDLQLARSSAATLEVSPYLWGPTPINDDITKAVGPERISRVWPVREMIDSGALVVPGSDWAVVPSVNPWIAIETLVTRERPGGSHDSFGKAEAITLREALDLFTVNSARHIGMTHRRGQIDPGMLADLVVVDQDPFAVPVTSLHKTMVLMTIVNGEIVFER